MLVCAANCKLSPKASKLFVCSGKYAKKICFFEVLETKCFGEFGDLKIVSRSQNMRHFYFVRIPYSLYLLILVFKPFF